MPSPIAHTAAGYLIGRKAKCSFKEVLIVFALSLSPDLDFFAGMIFGNLGAYHNNITHSIAYCIFVSLLSGAVAWFLKREKAFFWLLLGFIASGSHLMMDYFTVGRGLMLFWPLSGMRFQSGVKVFTGLSWSHGVFSYNHVWTFLNEMSLVMIGWVVYMCVRKIKQKDDK